MDYVRKVFTKHVTYGDSNMGSPDKFYDYIAVKLFRINKDIKDFDYNISVPIVSCPFPNIRLKDDAQDTNIVELRYIEPYSNLSNLSPSDKELYEKIEATDDFKNKLANKNLCIFSNSKLQYRNNDTWLNLGNSRYYIYIKGALKDEDRYLPKFKVNVNNKELSAEGFHKPFYKNNNYIHFDGNSYQEETFCNYDLVTGAEVYLVIYKGHLPKLMEYKDDYEDFVNNKTVVPSNTRYKDITGRPKEHRLKEKHLKGGDWNNINFIIQYTYLEECNYIDKQEIIKRSI